MALKKYDVFLSFRGEDTRKSFISHLYDALIQKKIETFIDNCIEKGDEISPALVKAIEESHVSIVTFSKDYASSKWCLNELIKILQCKKDEGQIVMPVFYNIQPTHVRNQTGSYKKAFAQHERDLKHNQDKLHKWKAALTEATSIVGYEFTSHKYRNESDLVKDIVEDVLRKLKHRYPFEAEGLVGVKKKCEEIESLLKIEFNDVRVVGLWGMGGVGKTTLAKILTGKLCPQFEGYCFLENIKEESVKLGLNVVRQRLLSALLDEENLRFDAPYVENPSIKRKLAKKKVFFVLDDVSSSKQIEDLFINNNINSCLGPGSRVIVTTRDKQVFSQFDECEIYEVNELNKQDSLQLFYLNAFRLNNPKTGYEELSESVVACYCKGNPLALKVLGMRLRSRSKETWESDLRKLQNIPDVNIHNVLKFSYDDLDWTEKNILLDIACFLKGKEKFRDELTSLLEACDFFAASGIQVLLDKALITLSKVDQISMHDLIQEMGREIVHQECIKEPGKRSRLWKAEEVVHVLKNNKGTESVEGIMFNAKGVEDLHLSSDSFKTMPNLRYLDIYGENVYFPDGLEWLSDKLRYLRWDAFPLDSLPSTFCVEMLVELHMPRSKLKKLWDGVQNLAKLKEIWLHYSKELIEMPDLSRAQNLEVIGLKDCESLHELHPNILSLPKLAALHLEGCRKIESLRNNNHSKSLLLLDLSECSSLTEFSVTSEKMQWLSLAGTAIREFPSCIWNNSKLSYLKLSDCKQLRIVRNKLLSDGDDDPERPLRSLGYLDLSGCTQINALNLGVLLDKIQSLNELYLSGCCNLEALPDNIQKQSMLRKLVLNDCRKLVSSVTRLLLPSLLSLRASNCTNLDTDSTQWLLLENMLQSIFPKGPPQYYETFLLLLPVQVLSNFDSFHSTEEASITIPPLMPKSGLYGFIFFTILSQGSYIDSSWLRCIYEHYEKDFELHGKGTLISDHVLLSWVQYRDCGVDNYNISFEFKLGRPSQNQWSTEEIKGCGVLPIYYPLEGGGCLVTSRDSGVGSNAQVSHHVYFVPFQLVVYFFCFFFVLYFIAIA